MQSPRSVHWLLDIDGVINADRPGRMMPADPNFRPEWSACTRQHVLCDSVLFRLYWSQELLTEILKLTVDFPSLEIFLCSTWCLDPKDLLAKLGFDWPSAFTIARLGQDVWDQKEQAVKDRITAGTPVIWTDDEAETIWTVGEPRTNALVLAPSYLSGLNRFHLELIRTFLEVQTYEG